jgi:preprotein translocase subunit SecB
MVELRLGKKLVYHWIRVSIYKRGESLMTDTDKDKELKQQLEIQRIYVKDLSLETPNTPKIFKEEWRPEVSIDLDVQHSKIEDKIFEVTLSVTVTAKMKEETAFLVEVKQAGIFYIDGFSEEQKDHLLNAYCPNVLFPYARECVSDFVTRASFPPLNLAPVSFEALYMQQQEEKKAAGEKTKEETKH